jgi:hypothetical protein
MKKSHRTTTTTPEHSRIVAPAGYDRGACRLIDRDYKNLHHPKIWIFKFRDLDLSAECLWISYTNHDSDATASLDAAFMLAGMSLENLLKARLLCNYHWPLNKADIKKVVSCGHNLVSLAKQTKLSISLDDESTLSKLSGYIYWRGRYPVPKTKKKYTESDGSLRWCNYTELRNKLAAPIQAAVKDYANRTHPPVIPTEKAPL